MQTTTVSPRQQTDTLAIVSFVAGVAQCVLLLPATIVAIVCGHIARRRIRDGEADSSNSGFASAGLILGYIGLAMYLLVAAFVAALLFARAA